MTDRIKWTVIGYATKNGSRYQIIKTEHHGEDVYNITKEGRPLPTGGYFELAPIMRVYGISEYIPA